MRPSRLALALLAAALAAAPRLARATPIGGGGSSASPALTMPIGARAAGLGTAFTALADDISTLHYNPAGLANLHYREASVMWLSGQEDQDVEWLAAGTPLPFTGFTGAGYATLGASLLLAQNGDIEFNSTNPDGSLRSSETLDAGGDVVAALGYAERVGESLWEEPEKSFHIQHFVGATGKFIRSTLAEVYAAQTGAVDVGYLARCPELGLSLGGSVLNLGGRMRYLDVGDPLPLTLRAGAAWAAPVPLPHAFVWANDAEYHYYEREWYVNTGIEYTLFKQWAARFGYQLHRDLGGLTVGFGARWRNWAMDYAWGLQEDLGDTHRFSFTFRFGGVPVRQREKAHRPFIESVPDREELRELEQERPATFDRPRRPRRQAPEGRGAPGWIY